MTSDRTAEPIAIIGMGCRLPGGVDSPEQFWQFLADGGQATSEIPAERWARYEARYGAALRTATRQGGFIADAAGFDAEFFGVTPREAELMDPQQRIVLEVVWQALEDAGVPPSGLAGTDAGVFMGVGSDDYGRQMLEDLPSIEAWTGIGAGMCAVANRVSYMLDLRGPSLSVDTACSASLVSLHLACTSLNAGESTLAITGGVNLIAGPGLTMVLDKAGATSPDGRSKSFDAAADGYGRGEGCGVLVLKRLADAERDGDRILAAIRGSAVNQDGRTNGIMAPNGEAQEYVVRQALRRAGVSPDTVDYVEAHGTGTRMGDPLEAGALGAVYGRSGDGAGPCLIGSVKANIGHLEAGAGVAGVIKAVLALRHAELPPSVNLRAPNPAIAWDESGLELVTERRPWPVDRAPRRAAVSSFGYGGTVGHVVLEQAPERATAMSPGEALPVYAVSGASPQAVRDYAGRLAGWLAAGGERTNLADLAHTLLVRRTHLPYRAAIVAADRPELEAGLRRLAQEEATEDEIVRTIPAAPADAVWVFSGHGSQWSGMGRELLAAEPAFAEVIDEIGAVFAEEIGFTPREVLSGGDLGGVDRIQPMIFAMQVGLAALWRSYGVRPAAVIGHSVGEIAAAAAAGVFDVRDASRLICRRSKLLRKVAGRGAMAMVTLPYDEVAGRLGDRSDVVAAISPSPRSTVVSGDPVAVRELSEQWKAEGSAVRQVASDVAFHSPQMDGLLDDLAAAAADLDIAEPQLPFYTTALDDPRSRPRHDGSYWAANLRNPVRLAAAVAAAAEDGHRLFLEVSAHPVVAHSISETLEDAGVRDGHMTVTLRRDKPERATFLAGLCDLHCHGGHVRWSARAKGELVPLPLIAWRHRPFWFQPSSLTAAQAQGHDVGSHTLLGRPIPVAGVPSLRVWQTYLDHDTRPYPGTHPIHGVEIMPAAVLFTTFLAATGSPSLTDVSLRTPVSLASPHEIQVVHQEGAVRIASRPVAEDGDDTAGDSWTTHTTAATGQGGTAGGRFDLEGTLTRYRQRMDPGMVEARLHEVGVADKGFGWKIERLAGGDDGVLATVSADDSTWASLLDAVVTVAPMVFEGDPILRMPSYVRELAVHGDAPARALVLVRLVGDDLVDVTVVESTGRIAAKLTGLRFTPLGGDPAAQESPRRLLHRIDWTPIELETDDSRQARPAVLVGGAEDLLRRLSDHFSAAGTDVTAVPGPDELTERDLGADVIVLSEGGDGDIAELAFRQSWQLARTAQSLVDADAGGRLWAVTRGLRDLPDDTALGQAPWWGLGRIIAGEHPEVWGGMIDLPADPEPADLAALPGVLAARPAEDVIGIGSGSVAASRLVPVEAEPCRPSLTCRADGTYVITGGLGVLGLEIAGWLVGRGARNIVLVGRTGLPPRAEWDQAGDPAVRRRIEGIRTLEALGVTVRVLALDITDPAESRRLLDADELGLPQVRGVVHAAGVLDNRILRHLDEESLRKVMRPKVAGALTLHRIFPPGSLDFLVLFSSNGLLLGLTGQASYAAGNAFLDALARHRDAETMSLAWTSWRGMGMAVNEAVDQELRDHGIGDISPPEAFQAWEAASRLDQPYLAVMPTVALEPGTRVRPILRRLEFERDSGAETAAEDLLAGLDAAQARERLVEEVARQVSAEVKMEAADLDVRRPLAELGLDSVMTVAIRRRLEKRLRTDVPTTLLWTHPTVAEVADYLAEHLLDGSEGAKETVAADA